MSTEQAAQFMDFMFAQHKSKSETKRKLEKELSGIISMLIFLLTSLDLEASLAALAATKPSVVQPKKYRDVSVMIHMTKPGNIALQLSYLIQNAKWEPCT